MPKWVNNQKGVTHLLLLLTIVSFVLLAFLYSTTNLKHKLSFNSLYQVFAKDELPKKPIQVTTSVKEIKDNKYKKVKADKEIPAKHSDSKKIKKRSHAHDSLSKESKKSSPDESSLPKKSSHSVLAAISDNTPPSTPSALQVEVSSSLTISARWDPSSDPDSGISYYVFGIGTLSSGDYSTLANVRWWQITYDANFSVNLNLELNKDYYVSVYAVNGAGLASPIVTSSSVRAVWHNIGQQSNSLKIAFADTGYDADGNLISGWTEEQKNKMQTFFNNMYPILLELYGPPATNYTVTIVRDLFYSGTNIFIPDLDQIRMDDSFYPQLFTHELIHAFRNDFIVSSNQNWEYDPTLSGFEEGFAQGVSYEAMNQYAQKYPNDTIVDPNSLWDSSYDWNYDYQNTPEIRGTDFWSDSGGTGLHWLRYEMAAAALRKINLESSGFYKKFNEEYYRRINETPSTLRSSRDLMVNIIKTLVPTIELKPADRWIDTQHIFYSKNVYGNKIFHRIQDYPWDELFAFQYLIFLKTMECGSEWVCPDGDGWVYHNLNGAQGTGKLVDSNGNVVWSGNLLIEPSQNPKDGYYGFGYDTKSLSTASSLDPWPGGNLEDYILNLKTMALYEFQTTFTDPSTNQQTTNSIFRVLGSDVTNSYRGVWGAVLGHKNGTIYLNHEKYGDEPGLTVTNGVFKGTRKWAGIYNSKTMYFDTVPGKVSITFQDSDTGITYKTQRNINYGSWDGSYMFFINFSEGEARDTIQPSVIITAPLNNSVAVADSTLSISANATDNVGVTKVEFLVDGVVIGTDTSSPYLASWTTSGVALKNYSLTAIAYDQAGNKSTSSVVSVVVQDTTKPIVTITTPANGTTLKKSTQVVISANASDNRAIQKLEFFVNNVLICTDSSVPYSCSWNVPKRPNVSYNLTVRAYDLSNNTSDATAKVIAK